MEVNKIYEGDALSVLKTFESKIFNTIVTSPPYYGLRAYGTNPVIWDGDENCQHEFTEEVKKGISGGPCILEGAGKAMTEARYTPDSKHGFCKKCGAWRGELGSEPSPELFIKHLVDIFREAKRTLRDDGTLWVNMGDSYWGGKGQSSQAWSTGHLDRETLEKSQHQISGKGQTRPTDGKHSVIKPKDLIGIPWMLAFALRADGWYLRQDIIWSKPNPMPESVTDRCTKSHEYIFLLSRSAHYYYDYEAIQEVATGFDGRKDQVMKGSKKYQNGYFPTDVKTQSIALIGHQRWKFKNLEPDGQSPNSIHVKRANGESDEVYPVRNKRSVWTVPTMSFSEAHFATFPEKLIVDCIKAGCPEGGLVLDPFGGANTTGLVSRKLNRNYVAIELNPKYIKIGEKREYEQIGLFL